MTAAITQAKLEGFPTLRQELGVAPTPPGAERLLAELVTRGLRADRYRIAAALVLALEAEAQHREEVA
jgi:hypothetical protein